MRAPIKNSCPDIDKGIKLLADIEFELKYLLKDIKARSIQDIEDVIDSACSRLKDIEGQFEEARSVNSDLRSWAEEELEKKEKEIEDLEEALEEMRNVFMP